MRKVGLGGQLGNAPAGKLSCQGSAHEFPLNGPLAALGKARIGRRTQIGQDHRAGLSTKMFDMQHQSCAMKLLAVEDLAAQRPRAVPHGEAKHGVANRFDVELPRPDRKRNLARFKERGLLAGREKALNGQPDLVRRTTGSPAVTAGRRCRQSCL